MGFESMHARMVEATGLLDPKKFNPEVFFARWFFSKKKTIPQEWIDQLAERYPYSGRAYRLDTVRHSGAPLTSWCRSIGGMQQWLMHVQCTRSDRHPPT